MRWALEKVDVSDCSKIKIDPSVIRIQLDYSLPSIACDLEIEGCGVVIDGANRCQIMQVTLGRVFVSNLTFTNGFARGSDGSEGAGGSAGMGGALFILGGEITLENIHFISNTAMGGMGGALIAPELKEESFQCDSRIETELPKSHRSENQLPGASALATSRGSISSLSSFAGKFVRILRIFNNKPHFSRGSASGIHGQCESGIGSIVFAGGGGLGGFGNAGNGGLEGGHGGNGGNGGVGYFFSPAVPSTSLDIAAIAFSGGGGFGGFANGANGGNGGIGGFGGGAGGHAGWLGGAGSPGCGGFAASDGNQTYGGSGAGFGGAVFVKNGSLSLLNCEFSLNKAIGGMGVLSGEGRGSCFHFS